MQVSGSTAIDYKNTYNIINELAPAIISREKIGNTNLIRLNPVPNQDIYSVEQKERRSF